MRHYKISKLLHDSTVSKVVTTKLSEINDLSSGQYEGTGLKILTPNKLLTRLQILLR